MSLWLNWALAAGFCLWFLATATVAVCYVVSRTVCNMCLQPEALHMLTTGLPTLPLCRNLSDVDRLGTVERYFVEVGVERYFVEVALGTALASRRVAMRLKFCTV